MLAGVVLHPAVALLAVQAAGVALPHRQGLVRIVEDALLLLLHVPHPGRAQAAGVRRLAAALREKGRAVQLHDPALPLGAAVGHHGVKVKEMAVQIIEFLCHVIRLRVPG